MKTSRLAKFESYVAKGAHCTNVGQWESDNPSPSAIKIKHPFRVFYFYLREWDENHRSGVRQQVDFGSVKIIHQHYPRCECVYVFKNLTFWNYTDYNVCHEKDISWIFIDNYAGADRVWCKIRTGTSG